ncbi:MAG TPA: substrate-binding domain-containing protein [Solirubrobacteraceae bacterium]|jgi:D-xylose transport system substrate-binding protein|nr:substrate-binding domain-containing protein [Solirubrobacteraceae bacterium]
MHLLRGKALAAVVALVAGLTVAACGSSNNSSKTNSSSSGGSSTSSSTPATISTKSFTNNFSAMASLKSLAGQGKGKVAAILPDTTSSTRYVEFDEPDLKKAMAAAGLPSSDIIVQNGQGSDSTFVTDAKADITNGASVLLIDPEDPGTGVTVANYAKAHGVAVVNYDRLSTPNGDYVSFNNYVVGQDIGKGFVTCAKAWGVSHPNVIMMRGAPTDNNATQFYVGYFNDVLKSYFSSGKYTLLAQTAGTWTPSDAQTEFEQAYTAHKSANSAVIPNDENGAPIITYLRSHGVKAKTFPTTGQDATLTGLQNILEGYQCGTVYKPVYAEAQAAVALAVYLRASKPAPSSLLNGSTVDPTSKKKVPSVLLTPFWVTPTNMKDTIVKDNFVPTSQLCSGAAKADCTKYGIS